ncbi:MAG: hypothetical protein IKC08_03710, partial [Lentisphaeria bacterium]|nr:hypothetical protein [Lentisphaeria bacterium]
MGLTFLLLPLLQSLCYLNTFTRGGDLFQRSYTALDSNGSFRAFYPYRAYSSLSEPSAALT